MKKATLIGRLGRDARIVESKNGSKFISFTMAVNSYLNGVEKTTWFDVISFNYSEKMAPYFTKGTAVEVFGDFDTRLEIGNDGKPYLRNDVRADWLDFARGTSQSGSTKTSETVVTDEIPPVQTPIDEAEEIHVTKAKQVKKTVVEVAPEQSVDDTDLPF